MAARPIDRDRYPILRYLTDYATASQETRDAMNEVRQIYADTTNRLAACMGGGDPAEISAGFRALKMAKDAHVAGMLALEDERPEGDGPGTVPMDGDGRDLFSQC